VCVGQLQNLLLLLALAKIMGDFIMALQFAVPPQKNKKKAKRKIELRPRRFELS